MIVLAIVAAAIAAWIASGAYGTVLFWSSVDALQGGDGVAWRELNDHDRNLFVLSAVIGGPVVLAVGGIGKGFVAIMRTANAL